MKTINALAARSRLGTILDEVSQEHVHYVIERLSKPLVVVVPFKEYQDHIHTLGIEHTQDVRKQFLEEVLAFRKTFRKKYIAVNDSTHITRHYRDSR